MNTDLKSDFTVGWSWESSQWNESISRFYI